MTRQRVAGLIAVLAMALGFQTGQAANLSGAIRNSQGNPICGLVLANGQFMFSCSPVGTYSLSNVPLDGNGQITLFGFADGHFPFRAVLGGAGGVYDIVLTVASSAPVNSNRSKTELLIGGTWTLTYTIISTFVDRYSFTAVSESTSSPGEYNASGIDEFGGAVIGGYNSKTGSWAILDTGTIIDKFFVFTFVDNNRISGCYYQINPPGSTNLSNCYSMVGSRFPPKLGEVRPERDALAEDRQRVFEAQKKLGERSEIDPVAVEAYLGLRGQLPR